MLRMLTLATYSVIVSSTYIHSSCTSWARSTHSCLSTNPRGSTKSNPWHEDQQGCRIGFCSNRRSPSRGGEVMANVRDTFCVEVFNKHTPPDQWITNVIVSLPQDWYSPRLHTRGKRSYMHILNTYVKEIKFPLEYKSALHWLTRSKRDDQCCVYGWLPILHHTKLRKVDLYSGGLIFPTTPGNDYF